MEGNKKAHSDGSLWAFLQRAGALDAEPERF
jgi:hypothetical protein